MEVKDSFGNFHKSLVLTLEGRDNHRVDASLVPIHGLAAHGLKCRKDSQPGSADKLPVSEGQEPGMPLE